MTDAMRDLYEGHQHLNCRRLSQNIYPLWTAPFMIFNTSMDKGGNGATPK